MNGACTFVPHSRFPYARKAGRWPHGGRLIHEATAETFVPRLNALFDLKNEGYEPHAIGLTPILLEPFCAPADLHCRGLCGGEADPGTGSDHESKVWPQQFHDVNCCGRVGSDERHGKEALTE